MDNTQSHTANLSIQRMMRCGIVVVLVVSLLSTGVMASPSFSSYDRNSSLAQANQPQTAFFGSGITITIHTEVGKDGTIQSYEMQMNMSQTMFARFRSNIKSAGYSSIEEQFVSGWSANGTKSFGHDYKKARHGNLVTITFSLKNYNTSDTTGVWVGKENGTISYADNRFYSPKSASASSEWNGYTLNYFLTMPGNITTSQSNRTHGTTAEWHLTGGQIARTPIIAKSKIPDDPGTNGLLKSGAVIVGGLVVLVGAVVAFRRRD